MGEVSAPEPLPGLGLWMPLDHRNSVCECRQPLVAAGSTQTPSRVSSFLFWDRNTTSRWEKGS